MLFHHNTHTHTFIWNTAAVVATRLLSNPCTYFLRLCCVVVAVTSQKTERGREHSDQIRKERKTPRAQEFIQQTKHMASSAREVWLTTEKCITTYAGLPETACVTEDQVTEEILAPLLKSGRMDDDDASFVREVSMGVSRHRPFLDATIQAYCNAKHRNRSDAIALIMVTYLLCFRFEEIGAEKFQAFIDGCTAYPRLAEFLGLLLHQSDTVQHVIPVWRTVVDDGYADHMMRKLQQFARDGAEDVYQVFFNKGNVTTAAAAPMDKTSAGGSVVPKKPTKPPTFKLFKWQQREEQEMMSGGTNSGRIRREPLPPFELRELMAIKPREVFPKITDQCTDAEKACIEAAKQGKKVSTLPSHIKHDNRTKERAIPFVRFRAAEAKMTDYEELRHQAEQAELEQRLKHMEAIGQARGSPEDIRAQMRHIASNVEVAHTYAVIRREDLLYRRQMEDEEKRILKKQQELRDDSEYQQWKAAEEAKEKRAQEIMIAQRKIEMSLADERARETKEKEKQKNLKMTKAYKAAKEESMAVLQDEEAVKKAELRHKSKELKHQLKADRQAAVSKMSEQKESIAQEIRTQSQQCEMAVALQLDFDRERKQALIKEIKEAHARFIEMQKSQKDKHETATPVDIGQIQTMTWAELKSKLAEVKTDHLRVEEERRKAILDLRNNRTAYMNECRDRIEQFRAERRDKKIAARDEVLSERERAATAAQKVEEARLLELQAMLQEKRDAKKALQRERRTEERQAKLAARLLSSDASAVQSQKWAEMERGRQNAVIRAQNEDLRERVQHKQLQEDLHTMRESRIEGRYQAHGALVDESDSAFGTKKALFAANKAVDDDIRLTALAQSKAMRQSSKALRCGTA